MRCGRAWWVKLQRTVLCGCSSMVYLPLLLGCQSVAIMHLQVNVDRLKDRIRAPLKKLSPKSASPDPDEEWKKPKSHHGAFGFFDNPVSCSLLLVNAVPPLLRYCTDMAVPSCVCLGDRPSGHLHVNQKERYPIPYP